MKIENNKIKKNIAVRNTLLYVLIVVSLFFFISNRLNHELVSYGDSDISSRIFWHGFYEHEKIDYLYMGNSHVFCGIDTDILDELNGKENVNLATAGESLHQTYYSLLEATRIFSPKKVYIDMYYMYSSGVWADYKNESFVTTTWRTSDNMSKLSPVRYKMILDTNDTEHYLNAVLPFSRFKDKFFSLEFRKGVYFQVESEDFRNYRSRYENDGIVSEFLQKGFMYCNMEMDNTVPLAAEKIPEEMILAQQPKEYLEKCIELCKEKNIELVLFVTPIWDTQLIATENYDAYINSVKEIAQKNNLEFVDFNLCKREYLELESNHFRDSGHLNTKGAEVFTKLFNQVMYGNKQETEKWFYSSYMEKLASDPPLIYGAYTRDSSYDQKRKDEWEIVNDSESKEREICSDINAKRTLNLAVCNKDQMEFEMYLEPIVDGEGIERQMVSELSDNTVIELPLVGNGLCYIDWRMKDNIAECGTFVVNY